MKEIGWNCDLSIFTIGRIVLSTKTNELGVLPFLVIMNMSAIMLNTGIVVSMVCVIRNAFHMKATNISLEQHMCQNKTIY